jgi:putative heme-binding domain-containing protein
VSNGFTTTDDAPTAGQAVFKKTCAACHRIQNEGGKVGPQLDGVGIRGIERILEDILDPNRNVDGAFRATVIVTNDGVTVQGLKLREEGGAVILGDAQGKEVRVAMTDIDEQRQTNLSPMPSNFAEQLKEDDLRVLLAYLLKQRQATATP